MTLDDMKSLLAGRLGQRTDIDDMIYAELRQAQTTLEKTPPYPWFLARPAATFVGQNLSLLPDDFIEFYMDIILITGRTGMGELWVPPVKIYGGEFEHIHDNSSGMPKNFSVVGPYLGLWPHPDVDYDLTYLYYGKDVVLTSPSSENTWSKKAEDLLIAEAGWHVARNIRDAQRASEFGQDRAEVRRRLAQETTSRLESMRRAVIASGEDALLGQVHWETGHQ